MEAWVDIVKVGGGVPALTKDSPTVNVMQEGVELIGLVGEATVIQEDVLTFPRISFHFGHDADRGCGFGDAHCGESRRHIRREPDRQSNVV